MERKDLEATWIEESHIYFKEEVDDVMDTYEARIKELELRLEELRELARRNAR